MPASALLDLPAFPTPRAVATDCTRPAVFSGRLLGAEVVVAPGRPVPTARLDHLLAQLDEQWDVRRRRSDLGRIRRYPNVMVAVSPVTVLLVRHVLDAVRLVGQPDDDPGAGQAKIDLRHGRVGLDPTAAALAARLTLTVAADLLADFCGGSGASTGYVQVGDSRRELGEPVPAWLHQVAQDQARGAIRQPASRADPRGE